MSKSPKNFNVELYEKGPEAFIREALNLAAERNDNVAKAQLQACLDTGMAPREVLPLQVMPE